MAKRSEYTEIVLELVDEILEMRAEAKQSTEVPFMQERVGAQGVRDRMNRLPRAQKRAMIKRLGIDKVLKLAGGK